MKWRRGLLRRRDPEIAPDEIFLDAANTGAFDRDQFEGRLERPLSQSTFSVLGSVLALLFVVLLAQAWNLEVWQGTAFAARSAQNSLEQQTLFPERGVIFDQHGVPLVTNESTANGFVKRVYKMPGFGNLLGYVSYPKKDIYGNYYDTDLKGVAGIEVAHNAELSGHNGTLLIEKDAVGNVKSQGTLVPPHSGAPLTLSIDARAQQAFYDAIAKLADRIPFSGGAGILMDANTGEVRALVSYPEYDPNVLSSGGPGSTIASYNTDSRHPYVNRPIQGLYTPGSVVKPLEASGALTDGVITPSYTINDTGSISVPNPYDAAHPNIFVDWKAIGVEDLRKAIGFSSDVYFYIVGGGYGSQKGLGIDRLDSWFRTFGLTSPTGIALPGEQHGFVPTPAWKQSTYNEPWRIGDTYHTAIGQYAMQVTPLEEARAIAAIANGGNLVTPTLIEGTPVQSVPLPVSADTLQVVREGMRLGVEQGTSIGLAVFDSFVHIAGKTGTAQTGTHNQYYNSWAVGFFPYEHPKYVYAIMMDNGPAGNLYGAAYAMAQVISAMHQTAPDYFQ